MRITEWQKLPISLTELCLDTTLRCGQSFRWRKSDDEVWSCALYGRLVSLRQDSTHLHYRATYPETALTIAFEPSKENDDTGALVHHYLNLSPNLTDLYTQWSTADKNFKLKASEFAGVRILKQDAWEALLGFICSSNNNIIRISQMMEKLCTHYGSLIGYYDSKPFYDLPCPAALSDPSVEAHLRALGFGYRAKYLYQTAMMVTEERELGWLDSLRNPESPIFGCEIAPAGEMLPEGRQGYRHAHEQLLALPGVGPKVADCVCLMGLGWGEAVPVDTHVWQIAQRDYKIGKGKHQTLTKAIYDAIGNHFRALWGKEAGWAHSVLFAADLRTFATKLTQKIEVTEIVEIKKDEEGKEEEVLRTVHVKSEMESTSIVKRELSDDENSSTDTKPTSNAELPKRRREK